MTKCQRSVVFAQPAQPLCSACIDGDSNNPTVPCKVRSLISPVLESLRWGACGPTKSFQGELQSRHGSRTPPIPVELRIVLLVCFHYIQASLQVPVNCSGFISTVLGLYQLVRLQCYGGLFQRFICQVCFKDGFFNYISTRSSPFELALLEGSSFGGGPFFFSLIRIADSTARLRPRRVPRGRPSRRPSTV